MTDSRIAVLPVGYSDGWPRALSGPGARADPRPAGAPGRPHLHEPLHGGRDPHSRRRQPATQAVLLGRQGDENITPEMLADLLGTIAYEVLTLPGPILDPGSSLIRRGRAGELHVPFPQQIFPGHHGRRPRVATRT